MYTSWKVNKDFLTSIFLESRLNDLLTHSCGYSIAQNNKREEFLRKLPSGTNQRVKEWHSRLHYMYWQTRKFNSHQNCFPSYLLRSGEI